MFDNLDSFTTRTNSQILSKPNLIRTKLLLFINHDIKTHLMMTKTKLNTKSSKEIASQCEQYEVVMHSPLIFGINEDKPLIIYTGDDLLESNQSIHNKQKYKNKKSSLTSSKFKRASVDSILTQSDSNINSLLTKTKKQLNLSTKSSPLKINKIIAIMTLRQIASELIIKPFLNNHLMRNFKKTGCDIINDTNTLKQIQQSLLKQKSLFYDTNQATKKQTQQIFTEKGGSREQPSIPQYSKAFKIDKKARHTQSIYYSNKNLKVVELKVDELN